MEPMSPLVTKPSAVAGAGRRAQVAIGVFAALVVGLGYGYSTKPAAASPGQNAAATVTPVRNTTLICPMVTGQGDADFAAITPAGMGTPGGGDTATVTAFNGKTPAITLNKGTGAIGTATGLSGDPANLNQESVAMVAQANGAYAPGYTVTETLKSTGAGTSHGLASTPCTAPDTDFWFLGAAADAKSALLNMYNSDQIAAEVNLSAYTQDGPVASGVMQTDQGLLVQPAALYTQPVDLTALATGTTPIAVHLSTTAGRVSAALLDSDPNGGRDFILAQKPSAHLVIPGIPAPTANAGTKMKLQLTLLSPTSDTDVALHWVGGSTITPNVQVPHLAAGKVQQVDLSGVPVAGEAAALQIDSANNTPLLAEIRVTAEGGSDEAYLSPVPALTGEAVVAGDTAGSVVQLTNTGTKDAQVKVTVEGSGDPAAQTITVAAGSTKAVPLQAPAGAASFAVSVDPMDGAASVFAARIMTAAGGLITVQSMSTALETVDVPPVRSDLSGVVPQAH
jgi:hypothetical protein